MTSSSEPKSFTEGEQKLLLSIFRNLNGNIDAKWDNVATECGYKEASVARQRWAQIRSKKILPSSADTPSKKQSPTKSKQSAKRAAKDDSADGDHDDAKDTGGGAEGAAADKPKKKRATKKIKMEEAISPEDEADTF